MPGTHDQDAGALRGLGAELRSRLERYVTALLDEARAVNLTAARTWASALGVLVRPSLEIRRAWPEARSPGSALDAGSGNGFPGVVVALLWPSSHVLLVERRAKKARAIRACLDAADIRNAAVLDADVRDLRRLRPDLIGTVDLVTVRAVGPLDRVTRMTADLLGPGGRIVHWKATDLSERERTAGARVARASGLAIETEIELVGAPGRLVRYGRPEPSS